MILEKTLESVSFKEKEDDGQEEIERLVNRLEGTKEPGELATSQ